MNDGKRVENFSIVVVALFLCLTCSSFSSQAATAPDSSGNSYAKVVDHGGVYKAGGDVLAPILIHSADPKYTRAAKRAHLQGDCILSFIVGTDGRAHDIQVKKKLGLGLDGKAIEAARKYRFRPATLRGKPVPVQMEMDVQFTFY